MRDRDGERQKEKERHRERDKQRERERESHRERERERERGRERERESGRAREREEIIKRPLFHKPFCIRELNATAASIFALRKISGETLCVLESHIWEPDKQAMYRTRGKAWN